MKQKLMLILVIIILTVIPSGCKQKNQASGGDVKPTPTISLIPTEVVDNTSLVSNDFFMEIEDIFSISGRGTVVTGRITSGHISVNAEIELIGVEKETIAVTVGGIEQFKKTLETAKAGDSVGILLNNLKKEDVEAGQYLMAKGSMPPAKQYSAKLKFSDAAFLENKVVRGLCYFNRTDINANIYLTSKVPDADGYVTAYIKMVSAFPMKEGVDFEVRESGNTIAFGKVVELEPADFNEIESNINSSSDTVKAEQTDQSSALDLISADNRVIMTLTDRGTAKVDVIKKVREITGLDLKEAKAIVDYVPSIITDNITKEEALSLQAEFKEIGATVIISEKEKASEQTDQSSALDLISADSRVIMTLTDRGTAKVDVIKKVREITGLGLAEAKAIVDYVPSIITDNITKEKALSLQAEFKDMGATVIISVFENE